eukprot:GFYU01000303.1.p1 GENE.GFYU01000303.1~~GFYU01000303.1.p1  ORF type:complete len:421 (-),score=103.59 GFYU01000303.1:215-1477(-)
MLDWFTWKPTNSKKLDEAEAKLLGRLTSPYKEYRVAAGEYNINTITVTKTPEPVPAHAVGEHEIAKTKPNSQSSPSTSNSKASSPATSTPATTESPAGTEAKSAPTESVPAPVADGSMTIVALHGFGAGSPYWVKNLDNLAQQGYRVHALDWMGMGKSDRPPFPSVSGMNDEQMVETVEKFFLDPFEEWRKSMGLKKFILMGHSLGGYLSCVYALKHPEVLHHVILVSPVGIPEAPAMPSTSIPWKFKVFKYLWDLNVTPQAFVRTIGPWGPGMVDKYTTRRFSHLDEELMNDISAYLYHSCAAPGSGEYAMNTILKPGAYARSPLIHRVKDIKVPTTFMYGDRDWMGSHHAVTAREHMSVPTEVIVVNDAGHHLYIDNSTEFNDKLNKVLKQRHPESQKSAADNGDAIATDYVQVVLPE